MTLFFQFYLIFGEGRMLLLEAFYLRFRGSASQRESSTPLFFSHIGCTCSYFSADVTDKSQCNIVDPRIGMTSKQLLACVLCTETLQPYSPISSASIACPCTCCGTHALDPSRVRFDNSTCTKCVVFTARSDTSGPSAANRARSMRYVAGHRRFVRRMTNSCQTASSNMGARFK